MTAQSEPKPFEKKTLVQGKPILCKFHSVPKEGKPATFNGQESARISLLFRVCDNKYPDLNGYPVFYRCNPWINDSDGRATNLYKLLCEMAGHELPAEWLRVDARDLTEDEWKNFYGYYVVKMKPPEFKEDGKTLKWQDIDEILNPEGIEFPVDSRNMDVRTPGPAGLPKPKAAPGTPATNPPPQTQTPPPASRPANTGPTPPVGKPAQADTKAPATSKPGAPAIQDVVNEIKVYVTPVGPARSLAIQFLAAKGKPKVTEMSEADVRLLHVLLQIEKLTHQGDEFAAEVQTNLANWKTTLLELNQNAAELLLSRLNDMASGVPI